MVATVQRPVLSKGGASDQRYRIGMWVALAAILMMFTSLSSAYIVRAASSNDWRPIAIPAALFFSTALIISSSLALEAARQKLKRDLTDHYRGYLLVSALMGIGFLLSQLWSWGQLAAQGIYIATNPHSSFFYLLTGTHGVHLLGGLLGLGLLLARSRDLLANEPSRARYQGIVGAVTLYWHFMAVLWIYLFVLLFFWR